ncbi:unnamed protein product [Ilex paraguariensis]|uniref:Uncharacterized protein n=1 Tax=Ilex paraguariensis TaxID=185542 RepID=A0ABC8UTG2_9AQUA
MDVMNGEVESSYAQHSFFTQKVISIIKPVVVNAVHSLFSEDFHRKKVLNVGNLGCAAGPNTFSVILTVKESLERKCKELNCQPPELQVYLNDLPGNDFNSLFKDLSRVGEDQKSDVLLPCFVMGAPSSFHGCLFPRSWLYLVHFSYSVHWLSQLLCPQDPRGLYEKYDLGNDQELLPHTNCLRFLDKAAILTQSQTIEEQENQKWRLCRITEVEETKIFFTMIPMLMAFIICGIVSSMGTSFFLEQAMRITHRFSMKIDANLKEPVDTVGGMNKMQPAARKEAAMERTRSSHHKAWKKNITLLIFTESRQVFEE